MNALKSPSVPVVDCHYNRTLVKRTDLVNRIRDMIVIVKNFEEQELLMHLPMTTIPYYLVGLDDEMEQEVRSYFAEMIFVAALEYPGDPAMPMSGIRVGRLARKSDKLTEWLKDAPRFSQAERDYISYWCNPVLIAHDPGTKLTLSSWGYGAYVNGQWVEQIVTADFIKRRIDFDELRHMIVYDHN